MLPKARKLSTELFNTVMQHGKANHAATVYIKLLKLADESPSRFAVVVSKKVHKLAVDRNKLKRKLFLHIQKLLPSLKAGHAVIFFVKKGQPDMDVKAYTDDVAILLQKALVQ